MPSASDSSSAVAPLSRLSSTWRSTRRRLSLMATGRGRRVALSSMRRGRRGRLRGVLAMMPRFVPQVTYGVNRPAAAVLTSANARLFTTASRRSRVTRPGRAGSWWVRGGPVRTKAQYVYESLREEIVQGRLRPGTRLVFSQVASRFGVSPIPVREAVRQLETEGLVELKPHTRVEVTTLPWEQGVWAYELRLALEPLAARDATPFVSEDQLARMGSLLDAMRDDLDGGDPDAFGADYYA